MAYLDIIKDPSKALALTKRGNRACYRLNTVREYLHEKHWKRHEDRSALDDAKIRRWRFGEEKRHEGNKTILLVGETGTGKTTLINALVNYILGVKFEDGVWFEITEENDEKQSVSQTSAVTVYNVETLPTSLTIIDTPGYGDTRGGDHDKTIADSLCELFESYGEVDRIDAVGLVVKSSQNRLTEFQRYIFESVLSLFGKDIEDNILILFTHSDGLTPTDALDAIKNAKTKCAKDVDDEPLYFLFNNRKCQPYRPNEAKVYKRIWTDGEHSLKDFLEFIQGIKGKSLKMTGDVLRKRKQLEACLRDLIRTINLVNEEEKQLKNINDIVRENKAKLDNNESFMYTITETKMVKVPIKEHFKFCDEKAMCCDHCKKNCHFPGCTWVVNLYWCSVMSQGKCTVCGCSDDKHTKEDKLYIPVNKIDRKTDKDLKKKYQDVHGKGVNMQHSIERELTEKRQQMSKLLEETYNVIIDLDKIALQECLNIHDDLDILIVKLSETNQHDKVQKLKEIKDRAPADNTRRCRGKVCP